MKAQLRGQARGNVPAVAQTTGFAAGTSVLTLDGAIPVEFLNIGDSVVTRSGISTLRSLSVAVVTGVVVRIGCSTLRHGRPAAQLLVGVGQMVMVRDWRAKALYGVELALVPVGRIADGQLIRRETVTGLRLFTPQFDTLEVIYAGGIELGFAAAMADA